MKTYHFNIILRFTCINFQMLVLALMNKFAEKLPKEIILGYLIYGIDKGKLHIVRRLVLHVSKYDNV